MDEDRSDGNGGGRTEGTGGRRLRALTFLAPGIPLEFFEAVTDHLARALGCAIELESESRSSGPMHGQSDPFAEGAEGAEAAEAAGNRADLGFLCSPSYLYLRARERPSIELVPAGFVFRDARGDGEPVYFSEVVVRADHSARAFEDLAGGVWGYNDTCSLSGYFAALQTLAGLGCNGSFFAERVETGSHHASIDALLAGAIDGAAIDSIVLSILRRERPELAGRLRVLDSWGPYPVQPVVVRGALGPGWAARIAAALLDLDPAREGGERLARFGFERCVPIDDDAYADERRALCDLGQIPDSPPRPSQP